MTATTSANGVHSLPLTGGNIAGLSLPTSSALALLPSQQREQINSQIASLLEQIDQLKQIEEKQQQLQSQDTEGGRVSQPVNGFSEAKKQAEAEASISQGPAEPGRTTPRKALCASEEEVSPAARVSRLEPRAEQVLLSLYGIQDMLSPEAALHVSKKAGCSEIQVREYFARLRSSMRGYVQKLQRRASGVTTGSHANPAMPGIPSAAGLPDEQQPTGVEGSSAMPADEGTESGRSESPEDIAQGFRALQARLDVTREAGLRKLRSCVSEKGGIKSTEAAERLLGVMQASSSWCVREACLQAIQQTLVPGVQKRLGASHALMVLLPQWIEAADADEQISFLRSLLLAIQYLRPNLAGPEQKPLLAALTQLQNHRSLHVANEAQLLIQQLSAKEEPLKKKPTALSSGPQAGSKTAGASGKTQAFDTSKKRRASDPPALSNAAKQQAVAATSAAPELPTSLAASTASAGMPVQQPTSFRPKAEVDLQQQRLQRTFQQYREKQIQLVNSRNGRFAVELSRISKGLADGPRMKPSLRGIYRVLSVVDYAALIGYQLGCGEESVEREAIEQHVQARVGVDYKSAFQIPDSPAEPEGEIHLVGKAPAKIPFSPVDAEEAKEQAELQRASGVALSHLLGAPSQPVISLHHMWQPQIKEEMAEEGVDNSREEAEEMEASIPEPVQQTLPPAFQPI